MTRTTRPKLDSKDELRHGVVLLVVLAFLALFAAVAISFVFYADSQAIAAHHYMQAQTRSLPDADPELLLEYFLKQLLFDTKDDALGVSSALRGHGLLRSTWGGEYDLNANGTLQLGNNTLAYNGTGRLHQVYPKTAPAPLQMQDDYNLINYTYFPSDGFVRDPERLGFRTDPTATRGLFVGGANPPYTYPDLNNVYLAAMKADGTVLTPSYHRLWLFGALDPSNPNWTNPVGKYLILRPRPAEHPASNGKSGFPFPDDATGDVKNSMGPGGNDSVWLDLDFPVLTHTDGRRFKPMFAPLIIDLDGKVNLNVHGNVRGVNSSHASNQGWGPWEVNLEKVCTVAPSEAKNLFLGGPGAKPSVWGRYGPDRQPTPNPLVAGATFGPTPHFYGRVDFDGCQANGLATLPVQLPTGVNCFPTFPGGYDNANTGECLHHPSLYNIVGPLGQLPGAYDRRFAPSYMEAFLRHADTGGPALADTAILCPQNFSDPRFRRLVTTLSNDLRRPGYSPWVSSNLPLAQVVRSQRYPDIPDKLLGGGPQAFPASPNLVTIYDDFARNGRAGDTPLSRVDVNRSLPDYPTPNVFSGKITDVAGFHAAQEARQALARDILVRLIKATGAFDPARYKSVATLGTFSPPSLQDLITLRWLAQWSANLVDFIDTDDYSTPFPWAKLTGSPAFAFEYGGEWVFGVEMPRVLLNEVYGETFFAGKTLAGRNYGVNLWVELFNPLKIDATLPHAGDVLLDGVYQLVLTKPNQNMLSSTDINNVLGDPDNTSGLQSYSPSQVYAVLDNFKPAVLPASDKAGKGFYVIGPQYPVPGVNPMNPKLGAWNPKPAFGTLRTPKLNYSVNVGPNPVGLPMSPSILLRRLACPAIPWQPSAAGDTPATPYNPYVTVDYLESIPLNNRTTSKGTDSIPAARPIHELNSIGRVQPFHGHAQYLLPQHPAAFPPPQAQLRHTFFSHNRDDNYLGNQPFDWLIHLDRPVISPMELVHAASCRPHQVTHLFKDTLNDGYQSYNHAPYWMLRDGASPLPRALELLETACRAGGAEQSDQIPGKINLNTIWDPEIFLALCDPQKSKYDPKLLKYLPPTSNYFNEDDVTQIYQWLLASRTPSGVPGPTDRPFKALASAEFLQSGSRYGEGNGLNDTIFRANPQHPLYDATKRPIRLFEVVKQPLLGTTIQEHPYQRYELLTKLFNQVTTRSNVFAVWLTVGFFEVNDEATRPIKLGAELGRSEGREVRHRMFALVDRSALIQLFPTEGQPPITSATPVPAPGPAFIIPSQMSDPKATNGNYAWSIRPGMMLRVAGFDASGTSASEDVVVNVASSFGFRATFSRAYPGGFTSITAYGNPGPRATPFNPARHPELVPYFSIIR